MLRYIALCIISSYWCWPSTVFAASNNMKPYPSPQKGYERRVIRLPVLRNEERHKVEILIGKRMVIDCNHHWFAGTLTQEIVKGWGYPYHILRNVKGPISTRTACPSDEVKEEAFVQLQGEHCLQRYNSKLPVVVYVPDGFEVRYKIWVAEEKISDSKAE